MSLPNQAQPDSSSSHVMPPFSPDPSANLFSSPTLSVHRPSTGLRFSTLCATVDNPDDDHGDLHGSSSVPIYQSATFKGMDGKYDYTRSGNPTRTFLQHHIAKISAAKHAFAVTSGMGALDIICRTLKPGDEIIAGNDLYGGSNRLLAYLSQHNGIHTHHVDTTSIEVVRPLLVPGSPVKMVLLESPTNPLLQIVDVEQIAREVKRAIPAALVVVDNTMMSPYLMRPLELGADIVYDSGTKYLSGHHDLMAGLVVCNDDELAAQLAFVINSIGNGLAPFECFLLLRGIKTLAVRLDRQQASARLVAAHLAQLGFKVNYPGLPSHPRKHVHDRLAAGPGAVLSFETGDKLLSERIVSSTRLWGISVSFGCVNSLISMPCLMSHASIDPAVRAARNLPEDLIRLCVGIEDSSDLVEDLQCALVAAGAIRIVDETVVGGAFERVRPASAGAASGGSRSESSGEFGGPTAARPDTLLVSAPGKVILFGEHAVVYGQRAVAAAVGLRCFCLVEPADTDSVALVLPDVGFTARWPIAKLPWEAVPQAGGAERGVDEKLARMVLVMTSEMSQLPGVAQACHAFLYLFMSLARRAHRRAQTYTVRSTLPIGAGLGSSAAYSVCLAGALLYSHEHLGLPRIGGLDEPTVELVNGWAFVGEKILHGSPSGVDNTVASHGGALCFQRTTGGRGVTEPVKGFGKARLLITDTRVGRDTKDLVAGVARRKTEEPDFVQKTIEEIGQITEEAIAEMKNGSGEMEKKIGGLMERNHNLLSALGVSHERIESVRDVCRSKGLNSTKITGAGGGGCAISLVPEEVSEEKLDSLVTELESQGMKCYVCEVGGKGMGVLEVIGDERIKEAKKMFLSNSSSGGGVGEIDGWVF